MHALSRILMGLSLPFGQESGAETSRHFIGPVCGEARGCIVINNLLLSLSQSGRLNAQLISIQQYEADVPLSGVGA